MRGAVLAVTVMLIVACGSASDEDQTALTCEILSDPGNCWADAAAEVQRCLPGSGAVGVLAMDRASCTFSDGTRVVFDAPLPPDTFTLEELGFSIERAGTECAHFVDTFQNRMEMDTESHSVVSELHPGSRFHLHCDDEVTYESSFDLLFECPSGTAPTDGFSVEPNLVTFSIFSVNTPGELFRCMP